MNKENLKFVAWRIGNHNFDNKPFFTENKEVADYYRKFNYDVIECYTKELTQ